MKELWGGGGRFIAKSLIDNDKLCFFHKKWGFFGKTMFFFLFFFRQNVSTRTAVVVQAYLWSGLNLAHKWETQSECWVIYFDVVFFFLLGNHSLYLSFDTFENLMRLEGNEQRNFNPQVRGRVKCVLWNYWWIQVTFYQICISKLYSSLVTDGNNTKIQNLILHIQCFNCRLKCIIGLFSKKEKQCQNTNG